jgi:hypothetical protein
MSNLNVVLLHDQMENKEGRIVTTSLTLIDMHDIARSCCTYGVKRLFIAHPSDALRKLARTLYQHWDVGSGSTYNPNRKEALESVRIVSSLDEAIHTIDLESKQLPKLVATSAKPGPDRVPFSKFRHMLCEDNLEYLLMLGTGWGMSKMLLDRADYFLSPVDGPTEYNHLSVRSALAIMLDRVLGIQN